MMQFLRIVFSVLSGVVLLCDSSGASTPTVSYTALSDAARKSGQLARYESVPVTKRSIKIGDHSIDIGVPRTVRAYDVIPIQYTLSQPAGECVTAIETVAYENKKKAGDRALYDLAIPGNMNVKIDYLGSVCADWDKSKHHPMTLDGKSPISAFLPFKRDTLVTSSTIHPADLSWFKFRITNTGDTILDPEGFSALFIEPQITRIGKDGKAEWTRGAENLFVRPLTYMYPGDSEEFWVVYYIPDFPNQRGFIEGDYKIEMGLLYRAYKDFNWGMNIWRGEKFASFEMPIRVVKGGGVTPVGRPPKNWIINGSYLDKLGGGINLHGWLPQPKWLPKPTPGPRGWGTAGEYFGVAGNAIALLKEITCLKDCLDKYKCENGGRW